MMPQTWGLEESAPLDPPNYGYRTGFRTPEPGEIKLQGWVAVAEGATGIMFFTSVAIRPDEHEIWDYGFKETANTRAAGELFGELKKVAPLLCRLERDYKEKGLVLKFLDGGTGLSSRLERDYKEKGLVAVKSGSALAHSFVKRPGYPGTGRYVILASTDGFASQVVSLEIAGGQQVYDMVRRNVITDLGNIKLGAGEGMVLLIGTPGQFREDCLMIDEQLKRYYEYRGLSKQSR
jgi:hypothetical protein